MARINRHFADARGTSPHRVVVGYDDSAVAVRALGWAVREARRRNGTLEIVVAWRPLSRATTPYGADSEKLHSAVVARDAARLARRIDPSVRIEVARVRGPAGKVLVRRSREATAVVLGTHSHLGIIGALVGSTARYVLRHSVVPVVLVGAHASVTAEERVVVGASQGRLTPAVLGWVADRLADVPGARLHVVDGCAALSPGARARHQQLVSALRGTLPRVTVTDELVQAEAHHVLTGQSTVHDLAVLALDGSTAGLELRSEPCPFVLVPAHRSAAVTTRPVRTAAAALASSIGGSS
jgi:nucleotide-binding universal stress UspA family protein